VFLRRIYFLYAGSSRSSGIEDVLVCQIRRVTSAMFLQIVTLLGPMHDDGGWP